MLTVRFKNVGEKTKEGLGERAKENVVFLRTDKKEKGKEKWEKVA